MVHFTDQPNQTDGEVGNLKKKNNNNDDEVKKEQKSEKKKMDEVCSERRTGARMSSPFSVCRWKNLMGSGGPMAGRQ